MQRFSEAMAAEPLDFSTCGSPSSSVGSAVAFLGEVAAVGHADDGEAEGELCEEKPDEPQPPLAPRASLGHGRVDHERDSQAPGHDDAPVGFDIP